MFKTINSFWKMIFNASKSENEGAKANRRTHKKDYTPSYMLIARDLQSKHFQVFYAAVYYLCVIAVCKKEYKNDIIDILNKALKTYHTNAERVVCITQMMKEKKLI